MRYTLLVIMAILCTVIVNWYSSANALKSALTENYLDNNYKYAKKLSLSTNNLLYHMQQSLYGLANTLGHKQMNQELLNERRSSMRDYFNSLFIVDSNGVIQLISPSQVQFNNTSTCRNENSIRNDEECISDEETLCF